MAEGTQGNSKTKAGNQVKDLQCKRISSRKVIDQAATSKNLNVRSCSLEVEVGIKTDLPLEVLKMIQDMVFSITGEPIQQPLVDPEMKTQPDVEVVPPPEEKPQEESEVEKMSEKPLDVWYKLLMLADVAEAELSKRRGAKCSVEHIPQP